MTRHTDPFVPSDVEGPDPTAGEPPRSEAPNPVPSPVEGTRTFSLNSPEAHEALCWPREEPWIRNGSLPREPRAWPRAVVVEPRSRR